MGIRRSAAAFADRATSKHPARQRRTRLVRAFEPETKHPVVFRRRISLKILPQEALQISVTRA